MEKDYPEEHSWLEVKEKQPCVLNVFEREDYVRYRTSLEKVEGNREAFLPQLLLADESEVAVRKYLDKGTLYKINCEELLVGVALVIPQTNTTIELKNIAIVPKYQGKGIGKEILRQLTEECQKDGYQTVLVGTANSSIDNIAFYQKAGFRMEAIEKDYFSHYPEPIYENGIRALDMIFFSKQL